MILNERDTLFSVQTPKAPCFVERNSGKRHLDGVMAVSENWSADSSCSAGGVEILDYWTWNVVRGPNGSFGPDVEVDTLLSVFSLCCAICPKNRSFLRAEGADICASELVRGHSFLKTKAVTKLGWNLDISRFKWGWWLSRIVEMAAPWGLPT